MRSLYRIHVRAANGVIVERDLHASPASTVYAALGVMLRDVAYDEGEVVFFCAGSPEEVERMTATSSLGPERRNDGCLCGDDWYRPAPACPVHSWR